MDRIREARRGASMVASSNGLSRRRHRSNNSLRDSPDDDGAVELQESVRLRERIKKDRDRDRERDREKERDRERDRERERERERERSSRGSKRRRGERMMIHGSNRDDGGEDSSEESVNDDEDEDEYDNAANMANNNGHHSGGGGGGGVRLLLPNPAVAMNPVSNHYHSSNSNSHHHNHHHNIGANNSSNNNINHNHQPQQHNLQHRKSFTPSSAKFFRAAPVWKSGDEMIGVPVPRKARSASTKRSHDWISNNTVGGNAAAVGGGGAEQIQQQAQSSPARQSLISTSTPSPAAPVSPSSSNASVRKKIKPNGPKQPRPPKSASSKASSSNPEELEIEIAEVLYGLMTQSQAPPKKEILSSDSREVNRSSGDAKSRVSSPISNSPSAATGNIQSSPVILPPSSIASAGVPMSAVAPKRKRPRQVSEGSYSVRSSPISSTTAKLESDQTSKAEISSPNLEKIPGSATEGGYDLSNLMTSQLPAVAAAEHQVTELMKVDSEVKAAAEELGESKDVPKEEMASSPKKESPVVKSEETNREDAATGSGLASAAKSTSLVPEACNKREEKFQIDLEAPPPQLRLSPEREGDICLGTNQKSIVADVDAEIKPIVGKGKPDEKMLKMVKENGTSTVGNEEKKLKSGTEDLEQFKSVENKGRVIDLQLDLEKSERDNGSGYKLQSVHKQPPPPPPPLLKASKEEPHTETNGQPNSLPLLMSMASWPGGPPPMGYMAPFQGVVSMDGSTVSPAPIQPFFSQPRPKRCATHCYIARNIHYLQQFMKMSPFWPTAAGSGSLFGSKACNISVVPPADLHGSIAGRGGNATQDKGPGVSMFPGNSGKDKASQSANIADANQRKQQILLQPALPPVAPNNILHGPAFIFPLSHQQAAVAAASARPASTKPPATASGTAGSGSASNSAAVCAAPTPGGAATAVSFNYPNMPANETQYLAFLQNNAYPFPLPAVGAPPNFRGTHPQSMPLFNGSFYSSQVIHPTQLQQQQQQQQQAPPASQPPQIQQSHQNASLSSSSSSSQKHLQSQQQRPAGNAVSGATATGNLHNFPAPKNRLSQHSQPSQNQHILPQVRQHENEVGNEDGSSTADSRGSRPPVNIYGQNFGMPIHPQNYALLTPPAALASAAASSGNSNQSDKKHQQSRAAGLKNVVESLPAQAFAMSFASVNGATAAPAIDLSSMAQNHAILQSLPEATRQNIQMMAANAAQVAQQQRKNFRISEDGKTVGDSSNTEDERKGLSGKSLANVGQSIAFSRSDLTDPSGSTPVANNVIDSSARSLNLASGPARSLRPAMPSSVGNVGVPSAQIQAHHQPQQMLQLPKHQQQYVAAAAAAAWSKNPVTTNGNLYPEHLSSSTPAAAKFPNALSAFPQNLVQSSNNGSPTQSPKWKNSTRTAPAQAFTSFTSSSASSLKSMPPQQGRNQQSHSQISFGANQKPSAGPTGQLVPGSNQSPAPPMMVGSPTTASISKGASGSPRTTTSASAGSKTGQASSFSGQQAKNSSVPNQKSSPVGGRNVPSILGIPHIAVASSSGPKPQVQQLQQQFAKNIQQAQLFFSTPYMQPQPQHSSSSNSTTTAPSGGYYVQRRRGDQQQQAHQPPGSSPSSTGMLSLSASLAGASTSDPAKAIVAATAAASNMKGGGLTSQSILQAAQFAAQPSGNQHQLMPASFTYVHAVPAGVAVKPAEQKQPAA